MPLHRNETSQQKENHNLSREHVTVFTQVSSSPEIDLKSELVFKGKGARTKVAVDNVKYQWSPTGSYRIEHMLKTISNLLNRFNPFTQKNFAIYVLDDYAVHLMSEVRKALWTCFFLLYIF